MNKFTLLFTILLLQTLYVSAEPKTVGVLGLKANELVFFPGNATQTSYTNFISDLRNQLLTSNNSLYGMAVLPSPKLLGLERYFEVKLLDGTESVTLGIDRTDLYIVGYRVRGDSYFFSDAPPESKRYLFQETNQLSLPFPGTYEELGDRTNITLGFSDLRNAVNSIYGSLDFYSHRRHLVVIIQMISEAARFHSIEAFFRQSISNSEHLSLLPTTTMIDLENNWHALSKAVQESRYGVFQSEISVTNREGGQTFITTVRQVILELAVMQFVCSWPKTMVETTTTLDYSNNCLKMVTQKDAACNDVEMTVNIIGRNGMCVELKDGDTKDGNPVELQPCGSQGKQKWTLMQDGTIRQSGKCMIVDDVILPGQIVTIFDCTKGLNRSFWTIRPDGSIVSTNHTNLVLSANHSAPGTTLSIIENQYAAFQGWLPNTSLQPFVITIIGFRDMCLEGDTTVSAKVRINICSNNYLNQQWTIYGDGSIRKKVDLSLCLAAKDLSAGSYIIIDKCDESANQRWVFQANGSILNPSSGLVVDVKHSDPNLHEIILYRPNLNRNQKWRQCF